MVDIQTVSIMLASASVIAGVIYYALQLRHQSKMRQTDLVTRLYSIHASEAFQREWFTLMEEKTNDYDTYRKKCAIEILPTALFFNEIGVLLSKKLIDIDLVNRLFQKSIMRYWERVKPILESGRRALNSPEWGWGLEYLCNEMKKYQQRGAKNG